MKRCRQTLQAKRKKKKKNKLYKVCIYSERYYN